MLVNILETSQSLLTFWNISQSQAINVKASVALDAEKHLVIFDFSTLAACLAVRALPFVSERADKHSI